MVLLNNFSVVFNNTERPLYIPRQSIDQIARIIDERETNSFIDRTRGFVYLYRLYKEYIGTGFDGEVVLLSF